MIEGSSEELMHKFSKAAKAVALMASVIFVTGVINAQGEHRQSAANIVQTTGKQIYAVKRVAGNSDTLRQNFNMASALAKKTVEDAASLTSTRVSAKTQAKSSVANSSVRKASIDKAVQTKTSGSAEKNDAPRDKTPRADQNQKPEEAVAPTQQKGTSNTATFSAPGSSEIKPKSTNKTVQKVQDANAESVTTPQQKAAQTLQTASNFSQVSTYWKSSGAHEKKAQSNYKMRIYSEPDKKGKVVTSVAVSDNFTVEQGDWVRVKTAGGQVGWALVRDVEKNINEAWNDEYQVIINGPSSNYSVSKVSPEERLKRQQAMRERQMARMQKLSRLWEQDFFDFDANDEATRNDEIQSLKKQVVALNSQLKHLQDVDQQKS
jgi:translation initiation factor 1 (eIF-1/SUI1)